MASPTEIMDKLTDVFVGVFDDDDISLSEETTAKDIDGWDSLSHIRLMLSVERAFGMKFSATEIGKLKNVGHLMELIRQHGG
jgi:acyl carrier protein